LTCNGARCFSQVVEGTREAERAAARDAEQEERLRKLHQQAERAASVRRPFTAWQHRRHIRRTHVHTFTPGPSLARGG
jgi:hypothetical protein